MVDYSIPLHIDFVVTYKNKHKTQGYWFITWIFGPGRIVIWRKTLRGTWQREVPKYDKEDLYSNAFVDYKGDVYSTGSIEDRFNQLLIDHMNQNGFPYAPPYKYWRDPGEPVETDELDGP